MSAREIDQRSPVEIVGTEAVDALAREGWAILPSDAYRAWCAELVESRERVRKVARALAKAAGTDGVLVELEVVDGSGTLIVCAPAAGDAGEERLCKRIALLLACAMPEAVRRIPGEPPAPEGGSNG